MEACQSAADEGFRVRAEKLLHIFQSDLFQALLGHVALVSQAEELGWQSSLGLGVSQLVKLLPVTLILNIQEFYELTVIENQTMGVPQIPVLPILCSPLALFSSSCFHFFLCCSTVIPPLSFAFLESTLRGHAAGRTHSRAQPPTPPRMQTHKPIRWLEVSDQLASGLALTRELQIWQASLAVLPKRLRTSRSRRGRVGQRTPRAQGPLTRNSGAEPEEQGSTAGSSGVMDLGMLTPWALEDVSESASPPPLHTHTPPLPPPCLPFISLSFFASVWERAFSRLLLMKGRTKLPLLCSCVLAAWAPAAGPEGWLAKLAVDAPASGSPQTNPPPPTLPEKMQNAGWEGSAKISHLEKKLPPIPQQLCRSVLGKVPPGGGPETRQMVDSWPCEREWAVVGSQ
ncbi:hypothetical protein JZ751_006736, partial [Albula glossodonta]